jgi:hypothetical protein
MLTFLWRVLQLLDGREYTNIAMRLCIADEAAGIRTNWCASLQSMVFGGEMIDLMID